MIELIGTRMGPREPHKTWSREICNAQSLAVHTSNIIFCWIKLPIQLVGDEFHETLVGEICLKTWGCISVKQLTPLSIVKRIINIIIDVINQLSYLHDI